MMRWKILPVILALMLLFQPISAFGDKETYTPQFGDKQSLGQDEIPGDKQNSPYNRLFDDKGFMPDKPKGIDLDGYIIILLGIGFIILLLLCWLLFLLAGRRKKKKRQKP